MFKKELPEQKEKGGYKLSNLAASILGTTINAGFHEALFDVNILRNLIDIKQKQEKLYQIRRSFNDSLQSIENKKKVNAIISQLGPLKTAVGKGIVEKLCLLNMTFDILFQTLKNNGEESVKKMLSMKCPLTKKPIVTKNKKSINSITTD